MLNMISKKTSILNLITSSPLLARKSRLSVQETSMPNLGKITDYGIEQ